MPDKRQFSLVRIGVYIDGFNPHYSSPGLQVGQVRLDDQLVEAPSGRPQPRLPGKGRRLPSPAGFGADRTPASVDRSRPDTRLRQPPRPRGCLTQCPVSLSSEGEPVGRRAWCCGSGGQLTTWMPRSCRSMCMKAASMSYVLVPAGPAGRVPVSRPARAPAGGTTDRFKLSGIMP
jgi:hypothetical protein